MKQGSTRITLAEVKAQILAKTITAPIAAVALDYLLSEIVAAVPANRNMALNVSRSDGSKYRTTIGDLKSTIDGGGSIDLDIVINVTNALLDQGERISPGYLKNTVLEISTDR